MLEKAIECKVDEEIFYWEAWETEVVIEIKAFMKNLDKGTDGGFELTIFVGEAPFVDGETNYGFQNVGIRVFVDRESLKNFYIELKSEMQKVPNAPT